MTSPKLAAAALVVATLLAGASAEATVVSVSYQVSGATLTTVQGDTLVVNANSGTINLTLDDPNPPTPMVLQNATYTPTYNPGIPFSGYSSSFSETLTITAPPATPGAQGYTQAFTVFFNNNIDNLTLNGAITPIMFAVGNVPYYLSVTPYISAVQQAPNGGPITIPVMAEWQITSVPEPATLIAGALLLLPFGVSTVRTLRKGKV